MLKKNLPATLRSSNKEKIEDYENKTVSIYVIKYTVKTAIL